jgi:GxxExxY protein
MTIERLIEREITRDIIGAFYEVYNQLGFGFLEFIYALALEKELLRRGRSVAREAAVPVIYKGEILANQRVDMIVDDKVMVEIKSTEVLHRKAPRLTLNYLRSTPLEVALLLHFGPEPRFYRFVSFN